MLKKYLQFIKENISDIEDQHHSLGEWIEELCEGNKEILELVRPYLEDTNPTVRISNTINVLESPDKNSVYKIVTDYLNGTGRKTDVRTFVDMTNEADTRSTQYFKKEPEDKKELNAGKNVFTSFLKVITSLGMKDTKPSWDNIPDDFLLFFEYKAEHDVIIERLKRFTSLSMFISKVPKNNPRLYFGIKNSMVFSFGFRQDDDTSPTSNISHSPSHTNEVVPIGSFPVNRAAVRFLQLLESSAAAHLKRELAYLNPDNLKVICGISKHMKLFHPGNTEKRSFRITDGTLEFGYHGLGKWNDGKPDDLDGVKKQFREHLLKLKGNENLQMKLVPGQNLWIYCIIKIK